MRITLVVAVMLALQTLQAWDEECQGCLAWIRWALCVVQAFQSPACWKLGTCLGVYPNIKYDQPSVGVADQSLLLGILIILGVSLLSELGSVGPLPEGFALSLVYRTMLMP